MLLKFKGEIATQVNSLCGLITIEPGQILDTDENTGKTYLSLYGQHFFVANVLAPEDVVVGSIVVEVVSEPIVSDEDKEAQKQALIAQIVAIDPTYSPNANIGIAKLTQKLEALQEEDTAKKALLDETIQTIKTVYVAKGLQEVEDSFFEGKTQEELNVILEEANAAEDIAQ